VLSSSSSSSSSPASLLEKREAAHGLGVCAIEANGRRLILQVEPLTLLNLLTPTFSHTHVGHVTLIATANGRRLILQVPAAVGIIGGQLSCGDAGIERYCALGV